VSPLLAAIVLAQAAPTCGPFDVVLANLREKYGEVVSVRALNKERNALVIFSNPKTGSWTAMVVMPNGTACGIDSGNGFDKYVGEPA
jgi:formylmethanofuran dehydrogenase subunit D